MNRIHFSLICALIVSSFVVIPAAQSWGSSLEIPQQKALYNTSSQNKTGISDVSSGTHGSSIVLAGGRHGGYRSSFGYRSHSGRSYGFGGRHRGYSTKGYGYGSHYRGYSGMRHYSPGRRDGYYHSKKHYYKPRHRGYYYGKKHGYNRHYKGYYGTRRGYEGHRNRYHGKTHIYIYPYRSYRYYYYNRWD